MLRYIVFGSSVHPYLLEMNLYTAQRVREWGLIVHVDMVKR